MWTAADALIAQGLRPTIERVRQHIGRGSPNTVSPMLEAWFSTLGARLGVMNASAEGAQESAAAPKPVLAAAQQLWEIAQREAVQVAEQALKEREIAAQLQQTLLASQREAIARSEASMEKQKEAMDQALKVAQSQAENLSKRLDEMQRQLQEQELLAGQLRLAAIEAAQQKETLQQKHADDVQAAASERQRMAEQYAGNERHLLTELDRSRQELSFQKKQSAEQERKAELRQQESQVKHERAEKEILELHTQVHIAESAAALAQERMQDLRSLLQAQQDAASSGLPEAIASKGSAGRKLNLSSARRSILLTRDRRSVR